MAQNLSSAQKLKMVIMLKALVTLVKVMGDMLVVRLTANDPWKRYKKAGLSSFNMSNLDKINV